MRLGGWLVMLTVMIMFLGFMGIPTALNPTIRTVGINITDNNSTLVSADIENSGFWKSLFAEEAFTVGGVTLSKGILLALIGTGTIIVGLFAKGYDVSLVILPVVVFVGGLFVSTFWIIIGHVAGFEQWWMTSLITILFGGLAIGFIMSLVDYFSGR